MRERVTSQSSDPRAAAYEALETAVATGRTVDLEVSGEVVEGIHSRELIVSVSPGTSVDAVANDLRTEARRQHAQEQQR
ncbi:hypothetical protein GCM10023088_80560 [Actinomadura verrucosospora]|uniref:hypothetical protein n=1 Tax=Actinomadura TaxID=1988 RepID=UPI0031F0267A